jgi:hypothetical protein
MIALLPHPFADFEHKRRRCEGERRVRAEQTTRGNGFLRLIIQRIAMIGHPR